MMLGLHRLFARIDEIGINGTLIKLSSTRLYRRLLFSENFAHESNVRGLDWQTLRLLRQA